MTPRSALSAALACSNESTAGQGSSTARRDERVASTEHTGTRTGPRKGACSHSYYSYRLNLPYVN